MPAELITAVALYGTKTGELSLLLETVQGLLAKSLGDAFRPYTLDQIHGTVIRLDGAADPRTGRIVNQRSLDVTGTPLAMDHARALEILTAQLTPPVDIRIGGLRPGAAAAFSSRGQHPYQRMFSVQGNAFVLMGWPVPTVTHGVARRPLDELRRAMSDAGVLHWYHDSPDDIDNDFHLVVGHHDGVPEQERALAVRTVRSYLTEHPVDVQVGTEQLTIIAADSPTLAPARFIGRLPADPAQIASLYR